MLGSQPNALFAGELKDYKRRMQSEIRGTGAFCSCGESRESCPFWSIVQDRYGLEEELNPAPGFSWRNLVLGVKVVTGLGLRRRRETAHGSLVSTIHEVARAIDPDLVYVVDSSKSTSNLEAITQLPNVEVSVVHLIRDGVAVAGSYKKRGFGALYGMASWSIGNIFTWLYLKRRGLRSLRVDYKALCVGDEATYRALNEFLGTNLKLDTAAEDIRRTHYHVVSGNGRVRRSASDFQGIHYSESPWDGSRLESLIADKVIRPLNRSFGIGRV